MKQEFCAKKQPSVAHPRHRCGAGRVYIIAPPLCRLPPPDPDTPSSPSSPTYSPPILDPTMSRAATDSHPACGEPHFPAGPRRSSGASLDSAAFSHLSGPHSASPSSSDEGLPRSVRGAAPELRRQIRKRQNSESAKRCRQRKKLETARQSEEMLHQARTVARLEACVATLAARLHHAQNTLRALTGAPQPPPGPWGHPGQVSIAQAIGAGAPPPPPPMPVGSQPFAAYPPPPFAHQQVDDAAALADAVDCLEGPDL